MLFRISFWISPPRHALTSCFWMMYICWYYLKYFMARRSITKVLNVLCSSGAFAISVWGFSSSLAFLSNALLSGQLLRPREFFRALGMCYSLRLLPSVMLARPRHIGLQSAFLKYCIRTSKTKRHAILWDVFGDEPGVMHRVTFSAFCGSVSLKRRKKNALQWFH